MEVKIISMGGCFNIILSVLTLGVYPLAAWINARSWPKSVDEAGLVSRGGRRIAWNEFTGIKKVITQIGRGGGTTEHYELKYPKGKIVVAAYRLVDGDRLLDYIWQRLPDQAKRAQ
jgi:hypothetical protein